MTTLKKGDYKKGRYPMEINYNVSGDERKRLVKAMAEHLQVTPKYLGVPSCAYQLDYFVVSKDGIVSFDDRADSEEIELLIEYLDRKGFRFEQSASDQKENDEDSTGLVINVERSKFSDGALKALEEIVESKANLLKKAIGTDRLDIETNDQYVTFNWFSESVEPECINAFSQLISSISEMAINSKRVWAKPKEYDNEKYAFRCFLLRLGFIGDEYKQTRKILLRNFTGSSAFKTKKEVVENGTES